MCPAYGEHCNPWADNPGCYMKTSKQHNPMASVLVSAFRFMLWILTLTFLCNGVKIVKFNKPFSLLLSLGIVFYHSNRNLDSDSKICMYPTSTYLEMVPPTVGWSLLHQSTVKPVPHIFALRPI